MKNLKDVLEKLRVDDIVLDKKFPIDGTLDDMIEFLKEEGFEGFNERDSKAALFNFQENKCFAYIIDDERKTFWFADTSEERISRGNPIFVIKYNSVFSPHYKYFVYYVINKDVEYIVKDDKKEFLKELNKRFGWK